MSLRKNLIATACTTSLLLAFAAPGQAAPLTVMSIDSPPQASAADGRGIMSDAAMEALQRAGLSGKLEFPPWPRAQQEVQAGKNILITGLSRTPEREGKYTWLFPVFSLDRAFASTGAPAASFAEAKSRFKQIAVALQSAQDHMLLREGFTVDQFATLSTEKQNNIPALLVMNRVDAWFTSIAEMKFALKGNPAAAKIVIGPPIGSGSVQYVACSPDCGSDIVAGLQKAAAEMKADGTMQAVIQRYQ